MAFQPLFVIELRSHHFKLTQLTLRAIPLVLEFAKRFVLKSLVKQPKVGFVMVPTRIFAARLKNNSEFRFHRHTFPAFQAYLKERSIDESLYQVIDTPFYPIRPSKIKLRKEWKLRDYQVPVVAYLTAKEPIGTRMVALRTGRGKTLCSLAAIAQYKQRTIILIKSAYLEKWGKDILTVLKAEPKDLMTVSGAAQLNGLIDLQKSNLLTASFILISSRTYQNYIEAYESMDADNFPYDCVPEDFFPLMQAGILLIDEVHQEFHAQFKALLYTHVPLLIGLSATLLSENHFLNEMYHVVYPRAQRYSEKGFKNYIKVIGVTYGFKEPERIRVTEYGSPLYSHHAFEKSVLRHAGTLLHYKKMIHHLAEIGYIEDYHPGDKLAIFASSIAMCTELTEYFQYHYPNLDVRRYVEDDPYENIIDADIRITTILSSGTAIDIPNLRTTILTVNVLSSQSNIQTLGRLRELPDRDVKFFYLWCHQLQKHRAYHEKRIEMLADRISSIRQYEYPEKL